MAVAETGTIINLENEGNIRFAKSSPRTQVSVMTLEKVVPTMKDAMHMMRILGRNCSGQKISAYVSMDSGPKKEGEIDGPEELIIVIVDNGRSRIYQDPQAREALRCIRCAACLNICPVYRQVGGYAYGWVYSGPMGQVAHAAPSGIWTGPRISIAPAPSAGPARASAPWASTTPVFSSITDHWTYPPSRQFRGNRRPWKEKAVFQGVGHGGQARLAVECWPFRWFALSSMRNVP